MSVNGMYGVFSPTFSPMIGRLCIYARVVFFRKLNTGNKFVDLFL